MLPVCVCVARYHPWFSETLRGASALPFRGDVFRFSSVECALKHAFSIALVFCTSNKIILNFRTTHYLIAKFSFQLIFQISFCPVRRKTTVYCWVVYTFFFICFEFHIFLCCSTFDHRLPLVLCSRADRLRSAVSYELEIVWFRSMVYAWLGSNIVRWFNCSTRLLTLWVKWLWDCKGL